MTQSTKKRRTDIKELIEKTKKEAEEKILRYEEKLKATEEKEVKAKNKKRSYILGCSGIEELQEHINEYERFFIDEINQLNEVVSNVNEAIENTQKRIAGKPSFSEQQDAIILQLQLDLASLQKDIVTIYRLVPELQHKYRELPTEECKPEEGPNIIIEE